MYNNINCKKEEAVHAGNTAMLQLAHVVVDLGQAVQTQFGVFFVCS